MHMRDFLGENARWLAAGALLTFASSFGQTFFVSLFGAEIRAELGLSHGGWGGAYTLGTVASAILLTFAGGLADRFRVRALALVVIGALALLCLAMASVSGFAMLALVIFGLRFLGQGALSHIAITAMGRWFNANRGRAMAVAALGFSLGESLLPLAAVAVAGAVGWRGAWVAAAGLLLAMAPLMLWLLARERTPRQIAESVEQTGMAGRQWTRAQALRHWVFWAVAPALLAPPFIGTAVFFQQAHVAAVKGWGIAAIAAAYPLYAGVTIAASFAAAWGVDRFGARRLLPLYQAPMALGVIVLALGDAPWTILATFALFGVTQGAAVAVLGSLWPELYGGRHIGAIRALAVAMMVLATALGPGLTGLMIDLGVGVERQFIGLGVWGFATCAFFAALAAKLRVEMAPPAAAKA